MKASGVVDVSIQVFLTSTQNGGEWSALYPNSCTPAEIVPGTLRTEGRMGPRTGFYNVEKKIIPSLLGSNSDPPAILP
jgi:hypothetical protein